MEQFFQFSIECRCLLEGGTGAAESEEIAYNPWPYYTYTGKLRPWKQTPIRTVPTSIGRPDYADHPIGKPISEESFRGKFEWKIRFFFH